MKILKKIALIVAVIIAIPLVVALFVSRNYKIERHIEINQPAGQVFDYVKYLRNQDHYSKWVRTDPAMKKSFRGTDGTVGFVYAWDGNKQAGKGEQEITALKEGEQVDVEVRFERPMAGIAKTPIFLAAMGQGKTKVTWGMQGRSSYPMNVMNLFMDQLLGKDLEESLSLLKAELEKS